ncbi:MAG: DNA polymerase III subunit alpha, partial [Chloroflexia bacterium]|nr:DNA polymerase III subunit alpha [Chloroflexia bacterium]
RFLSRERLEMPDIDTDFADSRRGEILDYIANKYGRENVAQIITYCTLGAKAALRDMGRVLGIELSEVDRVARLIPTLPVGTTIAQALERVPELRQIYETQPHLKDLIDWAKKVEGRMRSVGTHACGLVVSRSPLEDLVPLQRTTKDDQAVMAAFEGSTLAKMGLLKMDILGLTNLSIVAEALKYIERSTGQSLWLDQIPLDDPNVFASLGRGETRNVFQLESAGMTRYLMQLKPTRVEDLYAMVALYRPGPLEQIPLYIANKNNPGQIKYLHPILKPILEDTYGVIVYQEQIMQLLQSVADYTLGQAYVVIKAISKKNKALMAENGAIFKAGCLKKGISQQVADELWELILPFAGYSFNRPHATLYGLLSYQTSWLKVNYPVEYMAAVLTGAGGAIEDVAKGALEARRLGVAVLQPDVNASQKGFEIEALNGTLPVGVQFDRGIRFGLA